MIKSSQAQVNLDASTFFTVNRAVNPLLAINAPLITFATQLRHLKNIPDVEKLQTMLRDEIKIMETKAQKLGYPSQVILAARFFICALLDEFILTTTWGEKGNWQQYSLVDAFQKDANGGERFFTILNRSSEDAQIYIDALELGYVCLSSGFLGKYRHQTNHYELSQLQDHLYDVIRNIRGETTSQLLKSTPQKKLKKKRLWYLPPIWVTVVVTIIILSAIFIPYYQHLQQLSSPIIQALG